MTIKVNNIEIEGFVFSGGECHVSLPDLNIQEVTQIYAFLDKSDEIMRLIMTVDAVRQIRADTKIELTIPYMPYARQDRVCNVGEALAIRVMAGLINDLGCQKVTILDPHSDVTGALLNNVQIVPQADLVAQSRLAQTIYDNNWELVSPDAGAEKKTFTLAKELSENGQAVNVINASKVRDTATGEIIDTKVLQDPSGLDLLIVDDICDGGRTFIELAKVLKEQGANSVNLYVTHGIFSKGLDPLRAHISHVYCQHSFLSPEQTDDAFLTIFDTSNR